MCRSADCRDLPDSIFLWLEEYLRFNPIQDQCGPQGTLFLSHSINLYCVKLHSHYSIISYINYVYEPSEMFKGTCSNSKIKTPTFPSVFSWSWGAGQLTGRLGEAWSMLADRLRVRQKMAPDKKIRSSQYSHYKVWIIKFSLSNHKP